MLNLVCKDLDVFDDAVTAKDDLEAQLLMFGMVCDYISKNGIDNKTLILLGEFQSVLSRIFDNFSDFFDNTSGSENNL